MGIMCVNNTYATAPEDNYPYLGIGFEGAVVLFNGKGTGMVVSCSNGHHGVGDYLETWDESCFTECGGSITLENT